ncbi:MAG TPA: type II toxin-antitoxin system VapC family toxin [Pirellulales bacterium]|jgi:predicted nucleic acid-binding protein
MPCLVDTGILLRAFDVSSSEYRPIRQAFRTLWAREERLVVALQNLAEFWNVSTRPVDKNGYGLLVERAANRLTTIERICDVVTEDDESHDIWKGLVVTYSVSGVAVHDARLVSIMLAHRISTILTFNGQDFRRYKGISAAEPSGV